MTCENDVAFQADVVFDASGINHGAPSPGTIVSNHVLTSGAPVTGTRQLLVYSPGNAVLSNGEVASIPFSVGPQDTAHYTPGGLAGDWRVEGD